jgi:hypothetical protein
MLLEPRTKYTQLYNDACRGIDVLSGMEEGLRNRPVRRLQRSGAARRLPFGGLCTWAAEVAATDRENPNARLQHSNDQTLES